MVLDFLLGLKQKDNRKGIDQASIQPGSNVYCALLYSSSTNFLSHLFQT